MAHDVDAEKIDIVQCSIRRKKTLPIASFVNKRQKKMKKILTFDEEIVNVIDLEKKITFI